MMIEELIQKLIGEMQELNKNLSHISKGMIPTVTDDVPVKKDENQEADEEWDKQVKLANKKLKEAKKDEEAKPQATLADLQEVAGTLIKAGHKEEAKTTIQSFGVKKLSELKEDQYTEVLVALQMVFKPVLIKG